jgi:hypothetical protein
MPPKKFSHYTFSNTVANQPTQSQAAGASSPWGGPVGKPPIQASYIPPKQHRNR